MSEDRQEYYIGIYDQRVHPTSNNVTQNLLGYFTLSQKPLDGELIHALRFIHLDEPSVIGARFLPVAPDRGRHVHLEEFIPIIYFGKKGVYTSSNGEKTGTADVYDGRRQFCLREYDYIIDERGLAFGRDREKAMMDIPSFETLKKRAIADYQETVGGFMDAKLFKNSDETIGEMLEGDLGQATAQFVAERMCYRIPDNDSYGWRAEPVRPLAMAGILHRGNFTFMPEVVKQHENWRNRNMHQWHFYPSLDRTVGNR